MLKRCKYFQTSNYHGQNYNSWGLSTISWRGEKRRMIFKTHLPREMRVKVKLKCFSSISLIGQNRWRMLEIRTAWDINGQSRSETIIVLLLNLTFSQASFRNIVAYKQQRSFCGPTLDDAIWRGTKWNIMFFKIEKTPWNYSLQSGSTSQVSFE